MRGTPKLDIINADIVVSTDRVAFYYSRDTDLEFKLWAEAGEEFYITVYSTCLYTVIWDNTYNVGSLELVMVKLMI